MTSFVLSLRSLLSGAISKIIDPTFDPQDALSALGPNGDYSRWWRTISIFCGGLLTMSIAMLQIERISDSELAMPFLLAALEYASYVSAASYTIYGICYGLSHTANIQALREGTANSGGRRLFVFVIMFPPMAALWAAIFIITTFVATYICPSTMCDKLGSTVARLSGPATPLFVGLTVACQFSHGTGVAWIYMQYRAALAKAAQPSESV